MTGTSQPCLLSSSCVCPCVSVSSEGELLAPGPHFDCIFQNSCSSYGYILRLWGPTLNSYLTTFLGLAGIIGIEALKYLPTGGCESPEALSFVFDN